MWTPLKRWIPVAAFVLAALIAMSAAHATLIMGATIEELTSVSDEVVVGEVVELDPFLQDGRVMTRAVVRVAEPWHGGCAPGDDIEVLLHGGILGDIATRVPGATDLRLGESYVLFLEETAVPGAFLSVALSYSAFRVDGDIAVRDVADLTVLVPSGGGAIESPVTAYTLDELESRVRGATLVLPQ